MFVKRIIVLLLVFSFFFAAKGECNPFEADLKMNQEVSLDNDKLKIKFLRIVEDTRCPIDLECYWSGYAKAEIIVNISKTNYGHHFISNINNESYNLANEISIAKYEIELRFNAVSPPRGKVEVDPKDYKIRLIVTIKEQ